MTATPIIMPKLGLTMTEGTLTEWRVQPGDAVAKGDILFVVETDKIANEIEAPSAGRIETVDAAIGDVFKVGAVLATWRPDEGRPDEGAINGRTEHASAPRTQSAPPQASAVAPALSPSSTSGRIIATPLARRLARERHVDLKALTGTGRNGRIRARDIEARPAAPRRRKATSVEAVIAKRLTQAKQTIPHFYAMAEIDVTAAQTFRARLKKDNHSQPISLTHIIVAALGRALLAMPEIDTVWDDGDIVTLGEGDVGIAVDTPRGLLVPVVKKAGHLTLDQIAGTSKELIERARAGTLGAEDVSGGAITVSNVGMHGGAMLFPIINPGQSAILGVAAPRGVFRPDSAGAPVLRDELNLVVAADHRVSDGVRVMKFLAALRDLMSNPAQFLRTPDPTTQG